MDDEDDARLTVVGDGQHAEQQDQHQRQRGGVEWGHGCFLRECKTPPPGPLPEAERGRRDVLLPSPFRGGAGGGVPSKLSSPPPRRLATTWAAAAAPPGPG